MLMTWKTIWHEYPPLKYLIMVKSCDKLFPTNRNVMAKCIFFVIYKKLIEKFYEKLFYINSTKLDIIIELETSHVSLLLVSTS